jgi:UDP-N-acetylmuramoyl-tripeptide--D-alanyl-D-alanine ligase
MIPLTLAQVAAAVDGRIEDASPAIAVDEVTTDSRQVDPARATLFVARRGESADGHDHAEAAIRGGAVAVLASRPLPRLPSVLVDDTDEALRALAQHVRDTVDPTVIGVTGSVGKTTTKDFIAGACAASQPTVAAVGSFNNEMGVPLTLLATRPDTRVLVVEMGARGIGQVAELAGWARPSIGVVTAVAGVHLELFGDLDTIARTKGELIAALPPDGTAVLNQDDPRVAAMATRTTARVLRCSLEDTGADVVANQITLDDRARPRFTASTPWGVHEVALPVAGRHHVLNALLALGAAGAAGSDVAAACDALGNAPVSPSRASVQDVGGITVLDDAYNASPTSTLAALQTLADLAVTGRRVAVLGVMAEIGDGHDTEHWRVGNRAAGIVDHLVVVGDEAAHIAGGAREAGLARVDHLPDVDAAVAALADLSPGDAVLVKASRVAGLERVVAALRDQRGDVS